MAEIFGNDSGKRGCFRVFLVNSSASRGAVLEMPSGEYPRSTFSDPLMVVGFSAVQAEAVSFTKVFGGRVYTYAFGHDPNASYLSVDMMGFLMGPGKVSTIDGGRRVGGVSGGHPMDNLYGAYYDDRVSVSGQYAKLAVGDATPIRGFVTGISTQTSDPMCSLQRFSVRLALVEPHEA